jgi:phosphoribosyl-ATP pyrophosphohydrolase
VQFQALARGFPWAWDEEVVADVARLLAHRNALLAAASLAAADVIAEVVLRRGAPRAAGPECVL